MVKHKLIKRVNKEIEMLKKYYNSENVSTNNPTTEEELLIIYIKQNKFIANNFIIEIPFEYPFQGPEIYFVNNNLKIPYYEFYKNASRYYLNVKKIKFTEHICPCCFNLIANRQISTPLLTITKDIQFYESQFKRLQERFYCTKYINKINNINNDIINIIIEYI